MVSNIRSSLPSSAILCALCGSPCPGRGGSDLFWPFTLERHRAAERRLSAAELPWKHADDHPLVLQLRRLDVAAEILDVHAVEREQSVVRELVGRVGKHLLHALRPAEQLLRLRAHAIAVALRAFAKEAPNGEVHRVVGGDAVHPPDVDLLLEEP